MNSKTLKTENAKIFDEFSNLYQVVFGKTLEHGRCRVGELLDEIKPIPNRILEVGVGTGLTFRHYPGNITLDGIDINEPMLVQARDRALQFPQLKINLQNMDASALSFEESIFDVVYAPSVLSVVHTPEKMFEEMIRVAKPKSDILVICYAKKGSPFGNFVAKIAGPVTEKYFGFHMRLHEKFFEKYSSQVTFISKEDVNYVGPWPLSTLFHFKKK